MSVSQFLIRLAAHWPTVLGVTVGAVLIVCLLLIRQMNKAKRAAAPQPDMAPAGDLEAAVEVELLPPPAIPAPRQVRRTVARGFRTLRERVTSRTLRYRTPCFLLLGPESAGKTTLLRQLAPEAVSPADLTEAIGCRWHFFDRAVTIEVDGRLLLSDTQPGASDQAWAALHRALRFHRPERPIDGVVLAIPASDLFGPKRLDPEALVLRARGVYKRLQSAQRILGLRIPLYVVVTKCDLLVGFQDLCVAVPEEKRGESFGWSNPYALESAFVPEWIDEAFDSISDDLFEVQMEFLARGEVEDPDGLFQFSGTFRSLHDPLRTFTTELCRESAYQESFFFRGIYFTGDGTPDAAERLLDSDYHDQDAAESTETWALPPLPATLAVSREPYFLHDLFVDKIFGEAGLARSVAGSRVSRNRAILAMQAAILLIIVGGGIGIWRASVVLERESGLLLSVLSDIRVDLDFLNERATLPGKQPVRSWGTALNNRVFPLLSSMARVNENRLASFFLPSSWASSLHWDISESMRQGFTNIVLPAMYNAILAKADSIVAPPSPTATTIDAIANASAMPGIDGGQLPRYLSAVARLGRNLQRYDTVSFVGAEDTELQNLASLVQYLFAEELPPEFLENKRYHRTALWESYGQRITPRDRPRYNAAVVDRSEVLLRNYYDGLIYRLADIHARFQSAEAVQRLTPADLADFRKLRDELADVQRVLDGSEPFWFDETKPVGASLLSILDSIPATPLTTPKPIRDDFTRTFYKVRKEKLLELNQRLDQAGASAVTRGPGATMALSPQLSKLQLALDSLFSQSFVVAGPPLVAQAAPPPGAHVRWDVAGLDRALVEEKRYEAFVARRRAQGDPAMNHLVEGLALVQLEARLSDAVTRSMQPEAPSFTFGLRDRERDLRNRIAAFQEPAARLVQLLATTDRLGLTDTYDEIADLYATQAMGMLAEVDAVLEDGGAYRPAGGSLAGWDGTQPPIYVAFRARDLDELERYLGEQRTRVGYLVTNFAAPLLAGLTADPLSPYLADAGESAHALIAKWSGLVKELDRYEAKTGTSSVEVLEKFIREEMVVPDLKVCAVNSGRRVVTGGDFFLAARNRLRTQLYSRCEQLVVARAQQRYEAIQRYFNANLAGRYPFSRDLAPNSPEADIQAVRQFFGLYDQLGDFRTAITSADASSFLDRMEDVQAFLQPLLEADTTPGGPAFNVSVAFRANRDQERGADQIVDWSLALGGAPVNYRGQADQQSAVWRPGAPAALSLRWALQSSERPVRPQDGGVAVEDRDARFRYTGGWALLRLIQSHAAPGTRGDQGYLLHFEVPTARVGKTGSSPAETAQLYIQLKLDYSKAGPPPPFPVFPIRAPGTTRQTAASSDYLDLPRSPDRMMERRTSPSLDGGAR